MKTFLRILKYVKPYRITAIIAFIASIFFGFFNAISLWIVGSLITTIMGGGDSIKTNSIDSGAIHYKLDNFFDNIINSTNELEQLKIVCILLFFTFLFKNIFYYINWICVSVVQLKIIRDIRNNLYEKVQKFPLSFFDKNKTGNILSIMLNDINWITVTFNKTFHVFFHEAISMLILLILLFSISPMFTLLILLTAPLSAFIIIKIGQSIRRKATRSSFKIADLSQILSEKIAGIKIVKAFNMVDKEIKIFKKNNFNFFNLQYKQNKLLGLTTPINDLIGVSLAALLLWYGGQEVLFSGSMSSEDFIRFIIFLFALLQPVRKLGGSVGAIQSGIAGADRVFSIFDLKFDKMKKINAKDVKEFNNSIEIKDISFKYNNREKNILNNISLKIKKGQKVALVGKSGAGKTTLANLLLNFYHISSGEILLDGYNYDYINTLSIRNLIGLVSQEPILFNDTISNNIAYGKNNIDINLIKQAARNANINDFINSLDQNYETIIGDRGAILSGGQKQRLSIARAILRDTPILILDEATSSLDSESEIKVQKAIDNLLKDRTVIIIAHRLSTIKNADKIVVLDQGKIVEEGIHDELYSMKGFYTKLYDFQFKGNSE